MLTRDMANEKIGLLGRKIGMTQLFGEGDVIVPVTVVVGIVTLLALIALILFASTWNSWVGCGETFCEMMGNASSTCNLGFAFAMAMVLDTARNGAPTVQWWRSGCNVAFSWQFQRV